MGVVSLQCEVLILKVKYRLHIGVKTHRWQSAWCARKLLIHLLHMVQVEVSIAQRMDKLACLQATLLRNHHCQQGIRCYIERHAEEGVGTTLIELARELAIGNIELEQDVARWQCHILHIRYVPRRDNHTTRVGVILDCVNHLLNLVNSRTVWLTPAAPLIAIDVVEVALCITLNRRRGLLLRRHQKLLH